MSWSSRKGAIRRSSRDQDWVRVKPFVCGGTGELGKLPGVAVAENERDLAGNGLLDNLSGDGLFNFRKSASETNMGERVGGGVLGASGEGDRQSGKECNEVF